MQGWGRNIAPQGDITNARDLGLKSKIQKKFDSSFLIGKNFFGEDDSEKFYVYKLLRKVLKMIIVTGADGSGKYVTGWKSKG